MASKTVSRLRSSLRRLNIDATPIRAWRPTLGGYNYCGKPCWVPTRIRQGVGLAEPDRQVLVLEDHRQVVVQLRHLGVRRVVKSPYVCTEPQRTNRWSRFVSPLIGFSAQHCRAGCAAEFLAPARWGGGPLE